VNLCLLDETKQLPLRRELGYEENFVDGAKITVEFGEAWMVAVGLNLDFTDQLVHDVLLEYLRFVDDLQCADETRLPMPK
jgi:long-subunit fatty acid transport protein